MMFFGIDDETEELKAPPKESEPSQEKQPAKDKERSELEEIEEHVLRIVREDQTKT